jgi:tetratricopeptide (TPR) repeat protein
VYGRKKDYDRAIADYSEVIRLSPNADAFNGRCWARAVAARDLTQALADCNESLRLRPDNSHVLNSRGLVQFKLGAFDRAIADYSASIGKEPRDAGSLYARGIAKLRNGDTAGGNADITEAMAIRANIAEMYAGYGVTSDAPAILAKGTTPPESTNAGLPSQIQDDNVVSPQHR